MVRSAVLITALAMLAAFLPGVRHDVPPAVVPASPALAAPAEEHAPRESREAPPTRAGALPDQRIDSPRRSDRALARVPSRPPHRFAVPDVRPRAPACAIWTSPCALQVFRH
ncbi:hypothetical protein [Saccharothrix coeruleofusca]|uniref:Uncharacterized protein n=1 Tax=Saccharothrix coeruleofusca TaxID=33919 RepID=A0A918EBM8_9PSEU|nr:hypothetical protein [Saccharothrix coeruleofusca]MBP2334285.1 hypothetical protein [Saccharothrix coeruleofusca]GGP42186.1 hypothetical protein GCM10010185_11920 [Saccharothrix coeruleofusca]